MLVHWKSLIGFGFAFWILLCLTDLLGGKSRGYYMKDEEEIHENPYMHGLFENGAGGSFYENKVLKFGWSLALWNFVAFISSLVFCNFAKIMLWVIWKIFVYSRSRSQQTTELFYSLEKSTSSKIPVMIKSTPKPLRSSDTNLKIKPKINSDASCPNLLAPSSSNISVCTLDTLPNCRTLYKNDRIFSPGEKANEELDRHLENQCKRLREEMARIQATSLKEHAVLSRKLDAVTRDKKELSKLLAVAQKENRAAKQQIEELLQEKGNLIKKLENASKEFKTNIKTKKLALAKLEEVTTNVEMLKQQLEQVNRDKEILENKLKVLENEYEKLQERLILSDQQNFTDQEHRPERDFGINNTDKIESREVYGNGQLSTNDNRNHSSSVSQTDLDMKKIQVKIKQLEKNLENFNNKPDLNFRNGDQGESEISLSIVGNISESQTKTEDDTDFSDYHVSNSPRLRYWGEKAGDVFQSLATKVNEKVRLLDRIREKGETELDEYSSQESLDDSRCDARIVSSSIAFQNFLKSLQPNDTRRSHCDLIF